MSWLSNVRNKIASITKKETADNLWHKCKKCEAMVFLKEFEDNMHICPKCEHHGRIGPMLRFKQIMDENSWKFIPWVSVAKTIRYASSLIRRQGQPSMPQSSIWATVSA